MSGAGDGEAWRNRYESSRGVRWEKKSCRDINTINSREREWLKNNPRGSKCKDAKGSKRYEHERMDK